MPPKTQSRKQATKKPSRKRAIEDTESNEEELCPHGCLDRSGKPSKWHPAHKCKNRISALVANKTQAELNGLHPYFDLLMSLATLERLRAVEAAAAAKYGSQLHPISIDSSPIRPAATAEDARTEDAPAEDARVKDARAENARTKDAPAKDAPAKDAPAENAPAENAPAENAPAEDASSALAAEEDANKQINSTPALPPVTPVNSNGRELENGIPLYALGVNLL
jgi:hypothetical protein